MNPELRSRCTLCAALTDAVRPIPWCDCGGVLDLDFDPGPFEIDPSDFTLWRYRAMLPVRSRVAIAEPITPIAPIEIDGRRVDAKVDYLFPTGSFKDRGAAVLVSGLLDAGVASFVEDSSGNAGAAMATYAARAGIRCEIYCPASASGPKLAQIERADAVIHRVAGPRARATEALIGERGMRVYASHNWHPLFLHGTKTLAYEISEQYGPHPPDHIVAPAGGGSVLLGLELGYRELARLGRVGRVPALHAVQADACAPLIAPGRDPRPSLAEGILSPSPPRLDQLRKAVAGVATVSEEEIESGFREFGRRGLSVEPTTAVLWHGVGKLGLPPRDRVLVILTGSGIKFQPTAAPGEVP